MAPAMTHVRSAFLLLTACLCVSCSADDAHHEKRASTARTSSAIADARELWGVDWSADGTTLRERDGRIETVLAPSAGARSSMPAELGSDTLGVTDTATRMELRFAPQGMGRVKATIESGMVVYRGAAPGGGDVFVRPGPEGIEDFVVLKRPLPKREVRYRIELRGVAGLRLVDDVLEALDDSGTPRLRVKRPLVIDARQVQRRAKLSVFGCAVDTDPRGPWGRPVVAPGGEHCELAVSFDDAGLAYPLLVDPAWKLTSPMTVARGAHSMARLPNNKILAAGSNVASYLATAELFDPATNTWAVTGSMKSGRHSFPMFLLKTGKVLAAAGSGPGIDKSETYDPATGVWTLSGPMNQPHDFTAGALLGNGRVLVMGGGADNITSEIYDPTAGAWTVTGTAAIPRRNHSLITLGTADSSKVLLVGGENGTLPKETELYDPVLGTWSSAGNLAEGRAAFGAVRLNDGRVLVAGGSVGFNQRIATVEMYTPGSGWSSGPSLATGRAFYPLILMSDGRALAVAGGQSVISTELFNPTTNTWTNTGNLSSTREGHTSVLLNDGRGLVTGGWGNFGPTLDKSEVFELLPNGTACALAGECQSGFCADGVCCSSACSGLCNSCKAVDQASGTDGVCGPIKAGVDPANECKDDGSPSCQNNGFCDGAGACQQYPVSAGCTPQPCSSGSQCTSGQCQDGICCDTACGTCQACTAAKKGFGADGVCENVTADSDPDNECDEGPNFPTSCLADGMCNGSGACRVFAKDTVSCGNTQCSGGSAQGLLCNGAGQCLTATTSCEPYVCSGGSCVQNCATDNDCIATAFCTSQSTCLSKLTTGSACSAGKECQSGYCVDGICCGEPCGGQCEACNVAPNEGTCVPVTGAPVGSRPQCVGEGECGGACDGVNRTACAVPPSGQACGAPSCTVAEATFSECDGKGACVAETTSCSPFACGTDACLDSCSASEDCAQGFTCNPTTGNCVPAAGKCLSDGITLETGPGETKSCSPYRCQGGECTDPCVTSSQCVSGFACDQGKCVALEGEAADDGGGCGCRLASKQRDGSAALVLVGLALFMARRRSHRS
jgi:MYXO-CTERM domain-containing protein